MILLWLALVLPSSFVVEKYAGRIGLLAYAICAAAAVALIPAGAQKLRRSLVQWMWFATQYRLPILMYHSVSIDNRGYETSVSPESFKKQMDYLKRHHYDVISLNEFVEIRKNQNWLPRKTVVITLTTGP